jgi:CRP/FNR family transcriptional regulator, cyclic AMP receptor protein
LELFVYFVECTKVADVHQNLSDSASDAANHHLRARSAHTGESMRKVLFIFGELSDSDVEWMSDCGEVRTLQAGEPLVEAGHRVSDLSLVLRGEFTVSAAGREIARLDEGEIVGELSFLDARPPFASVVAAVASVVLAVPHAAIHARFTLDPGFAARFYRSLGIFLASRLRQTVGQFGVIDTNDRLAEDETSLDEIDPDVLDRSALAGRRFERLRARVGIT